MSEKSIVAEIARFRRMSVGELREKWLELYGEPSHSRNRTYLYKRLCWRLQELKYGGLDADTKARLDQLADEYPTFTRARIPRGFDPDRLVDDAPALAPTTKRDPRLPGPGTVISRRWRDRDLRLVIRESGFEIDGVVYASLSEAARVVTGQRWNGPLFWGLRKRKR